MSESKPSNALKGQNTSAQGKEQRDAALGPQPTKIQSPERAIDARNWFSLADVSEIAGGLTKNPKRDVAPKRAPYLRVANVYQNELRLDDVQTIGLTEQELIKTGLKKHDLLVVEGNGSKDQIGRIAIWDGSIDPCVHQNHLIRVRPCTAILPKFAAHWFSSKTGRTAIEQEASSTSGLYTLSISKVGRLQIPLPPLNEQKRIVAKIEELFSELEAGEESFRQARRQLGVYRQSLLKQAFEGKLTTPWRQQNPHLLESPGQLLKRIQEERESLGDSAATLRTSRKLISGIDLETGLVDSLSKLPEAWKWIALGNLACLITKGSSPKWQGFDYTDDASGLLFVTSENVRSGFLDLERPKYLGLGFNKSQAKSVLQDGDVLLNIVGASIGRAAVFQGDMVANINQAVALIRLTGFLDGKFLTYHLNSAQTYQLVTSKAVDVARANFSLADVNEIPVPLCSLPEQRETVRLLDEQFTVIEQNERELDAALKRSEALRQSILKKAFSGQLVPQDPTDEAVSVLLERIRAEREGAVKPTGKDMASTRKPATKLTKRGPKK